MLSVNYAKGIKPPSIYSQGQAKFGGKSFLSNIKNLVKKHNIIAKAGDALVKAAPVEHKALAGQLVNVVSQAATKQGMGKSKILKDINKFLKRTKIVSGITKGLIPAAEGLLGPESLPALQQSQEALERQGYGKRKPRATKIKRVATKRATKSRAERAPPRRKKM